MRAIVQISPLIIAADVGFFIEQDGLDDFISNSNRFLLFEAQVDHLLGEAARQGRLAFDKDGLPIIKR